MLDYGGHEQAFPFYIVCDVSQTMWDPNFNTSERIPLDVLQDAVPELIYRAELDPTINDAAFISVIEFSSRAEVILPLTRPADTRDIRPFTKGDQTDYAVIFELLRRRIDEDCRRLSATYALKQPAVFFLTDGIPYVGDHEQPQSIWFPARNRLLAPDFTYRPQVVAFGFGQARPKVLCRVASEQGGRRLAFIADRAVDVSAVLTALIDTLFISISASVAQGDLAIRVPEGMSWACPLAAG